MERISEWVKTCLHKSRFTDLKADKAIERIKANGGPVMRKYYCPHCHGYHLTKRII